MEKTQEIEKPGFFAKFKHRFARGVVIAGVSYVVFMIILLATNRTNVSADLLLLWILVPVFYLSIVSAALVELSWSAAAHFTRKALLEEQNQKKEREAVEDV